jgi:two-component system chemotaxis response regulator CheY
VYVATLSVFFNVLRGHMNSNEQKIPRRALIIDDQNTVCKIYTTVLKSLGVSFVDTASTGMAGIRSYLEHRPDIVLLDINMPGMDGLGVIQEIRKIDADANVIMLTSVSDKDIVIESLKKGAKNYLLKSDELSGIKERFTAIFNKLDLSRGAFIKHQSSSGQ